MNNNIEKWVCYKNIDGPFNNIITSVSINIIGDKIVFGNNNGNISIWHIDNKSRPITFTIGHGINIKSVEWCPVSYNLEQKYILSNSNNNILCIINAETGTIHKELRGHLKNITSVKWSPDGKYIASSADNAIRVWDIKLGIMEVLLTEHTSKINSIDWNLDSSMIVSSYIDGTISFWNPFKKCKKTILHDIISILTHKSSYLDEQFNLGLENEQINSIKWGPDGKNIAISTNNNVYIFNYIDKTLIPLIIENTTSKIISYIKWKPYINLYNPNSNNNSIKNYLILNNGNKLEIWNIKLHKCVSIFARNRELAHDFRQSLELAQDSSDSNNYNVINSIDWNLEKNIIVSCAGQTIYIWKKINKNKNL
jgi:WD40 repeat protein